VFDIAYIMYSPVVTSSNLALSGTLALLAVVAMYAVHRQFKVALRIVWLCQSVGCVCMQTLIMLLLLLL
jgi:hypothetical protein